MYECKVSAGTWRSLYLSHESVQVYMPVAGLP